MASLVAIKTQTITTPETMVTKRAVTNSDRGQRAVPTLLFYVKAFTSTPFHPTCHLIGIPAIAFMAMRLFAVYD